MQPTATAVPPLLHETGRLLEVDVQHSPLRQLTVSVVYGAHCDALLQPIATSFPPLGQDCPDIVVMYVRIMMASCCSIIFNEVGLQKVRI